jgi:hypothetical protein
VTDVVWERAHLIGSHVKQVFRVSRAVGNTSTCILSALDQSKVNPGQLVPLPRMSDLKTFHLDNCALGILYDRLSAAPQEHCEALLNVYDILQELQDRGVLELAKGTLGSSEKVLKILVDVAKKPEMIRGIRNLMILTTIGGLSRAGTPGKP